MNIKTSDTATLQGIIGHRGSRLVAPENTISSFEAAVSHGADAVELDVLETKDLVTMVIHDETLDRTTNGSGLISEKSYAEVKGLDAGSWFSEDFQHETLPKLKDVMDWSRNKTRLDIEVKPSAATPEFATRLLSIIDSQEAGTKVAVTSFSQDFIEGLEEQRPELETGVLYSARDSFKKAGIGLALGLGAGAAAAVAAAGALPVLAGVGFAVFGGIVGAAIGRGIGVRKVHKAIEQSSSDAVLPHWTLSTPSTIKKAHSESKRVVPYTVNKTSVAKFLLKTGVDGLVTDKPQEMRTLT